MVAPFGRVAQLGEHLLCKQGVRGSNPLTSTNLIRALSTTYAATSTAFCFCFLGRSAQQPALQELLDAGQVHLFAAVVLRYCAICTESLSTCCSTLIVLPSIYSTMGRVYFSWWMDLSVVSGWYSCPVTFEQRDQHAQNTLVVNGSWNADNYGSTWF